MISKQLYKHMLDWYVQRDYDTVEAFTEQQISRGLHRGWIDRELHDQWQALTPSEQTQLWQLVQQRSLHRIEPAR